MTSKKQPVANVAQTYQRTAIESRVIWRKAVRISPHRHTSRPYPERFRLPEWEWQRPKKSEQKQD